MTSSEEHTEQHSSSTAEPGQNNGEGRNRRRRRRGRGPGDARHAGQETSQAEQPQREPDNTPAGDSDAEQQSKPDGERRGRNRRRNRRGRGADDTPEGGSEASQEPTSAEDVAHGQPAQKTPPAQPQQRQKQNQQPARRQQEQPKKERQPRGSVLNRRPTRGDYDDAPKAKEDAPAYVPVVAATVEAYVSQHRGWQRDVLTTLRSMIKQAAPDIEETIMWSQPVFLSNGPVCFIKAYAESVHFGFWRGTELDDKDGLLTGDLTKMRHIAIKSAKEIKSDLFESMIRQAVKLNRDKGDPTLS